jgi:hypothetical protein
MTKSIGRPRAMVVVLIMAALGGIVVTLVSALLSAMS